MIKVIKTILKGAVGLLAGITVIILAAYMLDYHPVISALAIVTGCCYLVGVVIEGSSRT